MSVNNQTRWPRHLRLGLVLLLVVASTAVIGFGGLADLAEGTDPGPLGARSEPAHWPSPDRFAATRVLWPASPTLTLTPPWQLQEKERIR